MKKITKILAMLLILSAGNTNGQTDLNFNGSGYTLISQPEASDFYLGGGDFTWQCWVKSTDLGVFKSITGSYTNSGAKFFFGVHNGYVIASLGNQPAANSTTLVCDGNWHFISAARQSGQLIVYVDGVPEDTVTNNASVTSSAGLAIGRYEGVGYAVDAEVDMLSYWNDTRTSNEIVQDMNSCTYSGSEQGLIAYFPFDEGSGVMTSDMTNTYHADFMGGLDTITNAWDIGVSVMAQGTDTRTECGSYTWIDGNTYTASNNLATHTILGGSANGCDSLVTIDLTINSVSDITTSVMGATIQANNSNASYVWLDCDNNYSIIFAETGQSFSPSTNGNYAAQLSENGCIDTSACVSVMSVGILESNLGKDITVYPNPTQGNVSIDLGMTFRYVEMMLSDISGRQIRTIKYHDVQLLDFTMDEPAGVYFLTIKSKEESTVIQVVKD